MTDHTIEPEFWTFSCRVYALEGVSEACLRLQNKYDIDVNMLLFCLWFGATRGRFDNPSFNDAIRFSIDWNDSVVKPLRSARRWIKQSHSQLGPVRPEQLQTIREDIKTCELNAENAQQTGLEKIALRLPTIALTRGEAIEAITANFARYCESSKIEIDESSQTRVHFITKQALDGMLRPE